MTTYDASAVSNTVIAHKKGITLQQGRALRDNPIAISEGSENAPKVSGAAFGPGYWLGPKLGPTATYVQDLSNIRWLKVEFGSPSSIGLSNDGGVTWGAYESFTVSGVVINPKYIDLQTGEVLALGAVTPVPRFTPLSGCNAVRFAIPAVALGEPGSIDLYAIQGRTSW